LLTAALLTTTLFFAFALLALALLSLAIALFTALLTGAGSFARFVRILL
jgi:hypothetical protein